MLEYTVCQYFDEDEDREKQIIDDAVVKAYDSLIRLIDALHDEVHRDT